MKKRRIKKSVIRKLIILVVGILLLFTAAIMTIKTINTMKYHKTDEYKLLQVGYDTNEITDILANEQLTNYALNNEYNEHIKFFIKEKYFILENLERYLNYKQHHNESYKDIISIVNVNADNDWYTNPTKTDISKKELMLVNKFNYLEDTYEISDVKQIAKRYAYSDNKSNDEIMFYYKQMFTQAEKDGMELIISSAYRTFEEQQETYEYYKKTKGEEYANNYAAKAGFSEHQTGYAFDILTTNATLNNFEETKEFNWLKDNAYKYGFIMRYPKDKENITGYKYEPWHYRYVGVEIAKRIHDELITFDEYYAYYIAR